MKLQCSIAFLYVYQAGYPGYKPTETAWVVLRINGTLGPFLVATTELKLVEFTPITVVY